MQPIEFVWPQYEVRVSHLRHAAVELDAAADDALGADRQQPRKLIALHVEIDQASRSRCCRCTAPGKAGAQARLMCLDAHRDRRDPVRLERADRRRGAPVDDAARQMPDEVEDERAGEALEQLC